MFSLYGYTCMSLKSRKITVLIDQNNFENLEDYCNLNGHKKSTLIFKLICDFIDKQNKSRDSENELKHE
jgi:hypothetical protein